jgi:hypothetical protein
MPARPCTLKSSRWTTLPALSIQLTLFALACAGLPACCQQLPEAPPTHLDLTLAASITPSPALPDAPEPDDPQANLRTNARIELHPPASLTLRQRFVLQTRTSFAPLAFVVPAAEAAITMADPPTRYPRDWSDGPAAFARNYGAELGRHTTGGYAHFVTAAILHEDPRYTPSTHTNYFARTLHATIFTLIDRSNSGHPTFAASNFAGSAAAGFIGMAWEPDGFNDVTHAYQRSAVELTSFVGHNLLEEFSPELNRVMVKLHLAHAQAALMPPTTTTATPAQP